MKGLEGPWVSIPSGEALRSVQVYADVISTSFALIGGCRLVFLDEPEDHVRDAARACQQGCLRSLQTSTTGEASKTGGDGHVDLPEL
jgi:hypothetical protein